MIINLTQIVTSSENLGKRKLHGFGLRSSWSVGHTASYYMSHSGVIWKMCDRWVIISSPGEARIFQLQMQMVYQLRKLGALVTKKKGQRSLSWCHFLEIRNIVSSIN